MYVSFFFVLTLDFFRYFFLKYTKYVFVMGDRRCRRPCCTLPDGKHNNKKKLSPLFLCTGREPPPPQPPTLDPGSMKTPATAVDGQKLRRDELDDLIQRIL